MKYLPKIAKLSSDKEVQKYTEKRSAVGKKLLKKIKGKKNPDVIVTKNVYEVSKGQSSIDKSKLIFSIKAQEESLSNINLLLVIPKTVAKDINALDFSEEPEIIEKDPVIKWAFKNIPQGQTKDYAYTVSQDVQNFETLAVASADRPSWVARLIKKIIKILS